MIPVGPPLGQHGDPIRTHYARLSSEYDRRWATYLRLSLDAVLEVLPRDAETCILDVPCGTGELERRLADEGDRARFIAADLSHQMLQEARRKASPADVPWIECNVDRLPFVGNSFDCVVCASGLHYFAAPERALHEFRRVLRAGGTLILVDWCGDFLSVRLMGLWLRLIGSPFVKIYRSPECRRLLESASFSDCRMDRFRVDRTWKLMRFVCHKG